MGSGAWPNRAGSSDTWSPRRPRELLDRGREGVDKWRHYPWGTELHRGGPGRVPEHPWAPAVNGPRLDLAATQRRLRQSRADHSPCETQNPGVH